MKFVLLAPVFLLAGCAFPQSPAELTSSGNKNEVHCYSESHEKVGEKVKQYMNTCFASHMVTTVVPIGSAFIPISSQVHWEVVEEKLADGTRYSLKTDHGYTFSAEIFSRDQRCSTELSMYAMNIMWARNFSKLDKVVLGEKIDCPL